MSSIQYQNAAFFLAICSFPLYCTPVMCACGCVCEVYLLRMRMYWHAIPYQSFSNIWSEKIMESSEDVFNYRGYSKAWQHVSRKWWSLKASTLWFCLSKSLRLTCYTQPSTLLLHCSRLPLKVLDFFQRPTEPIYFRSSSFYTIGVPRIGQHIVSMPHFILFWVWSKWCMIKVKKKSEIRCVWLSCHSFSQYSEICLKQPPMGQYELAIIDRWSLGAVSCVMQPLHIRSP